MPVSVVTGASGGIGRWIALGLARAGHEVVVLGRDRKRCEDAQAWIASRERQARWSIAVADLSSMEATRETAAYIMARHSAIDVLVNNAGIFTPHREETQEGHERVLAVNHLAPFVLTRALLPALRRAKAGARVVNVGSSMADKARIDPDDLEGRRRWRMVRAYGQSKLALTIATFEWAARLRGTGIVANVVHPGAVATGLIRAGGPIGLAWRLMRPFMLSESEGADTPLHVALSEEFGVITGTYVKKRRPVTPNPLAQDAALAALVWQATEALVGG